MRNDLRIKIPIEYHCTNMSEAIDSSAFFTEAFDVSSGCMSGNNNNHCDLKHRLPVSHPRL